MKKCDEFGRGGGSGAGCHGAVGKSGSVSGGTRSVVSGGHDRGIISRRTRSDLSARVSMCDRNFSYNCTVKVKHKKGCNDLDVRA